MRTLRLLLPTGRLQRWHQALAAKLEADGHAVRVELCAPKETPSAALRLVEQLEALIYARDVRGVSEAIAGIALGSAAAGPDDLVFDLTDNSEPRAGAIAPLYDGAFGVAARDCALLDGRAPEIALAMKDSQRLQILAAGRPAVERRHVLADGRAAAVGCVATLVRAAAALQPTSASSMAVVSPNGSARPIRFLAAALAQAAQRRLMRLVAREQHWRIGWRALGPAANVLSALEWPAGQPWRWLRDDGRRYFADPFLFQEAGKTYVFCEEYPYETAKGIISVFTLDAEGRASAVRPVLERSYHLSYPLVFRYEGRIWMMPETCANDSLELYVAESFPDRWTLHATLLSNVSISDATLFSHLGRWRLIAATAEPGASTWDSLSLYCAPSPFGPWMRNGELPVLVDASAARPAGHVVNRNGVLWRPAQDCTKGYGSGLALCRIDALDDDLFRQTVVRRLGPPEGAPSLGVHTLNSSERFEVIDAVGVARASRRPREAA